MIVSQELIRELREKTGAGILDCKKALEDNQSNVEKAIEHLRKKGLASAVKKTARSTSEGLVSSYIHAGGKIGVLLEVNCETDFVARTEEFQAFVKDIAMQIAAANPQHVRREEVPAGLLETEKEVYRSQANQAKKPDAVVEKIIAGKIENFFHDTCLLEQTFIKNPDKNIQALVTELIAKLGENISIRRFCRFQLGA